MPSRIVSPIVIAELKSISSAAGGLLEPGQVVERARPLSSPLHSYFDWDNTVAAESWRIQQARQLISVCVEYIGEEETEMHVFVSLRSDRSGGKGYRRMVTVLSDHKMRRELLDDALAEMESFKTKYKTLKELVTVFQAMNSVERKLLKQ